MFSRLPSSCRYWADRRRKKNATFQSLPFLSVYNGFHKAVKALNELKICRYPYVDAQYILFCSLRSLPRPKTTRQHHKVRELNYQFNLDSALNMKRAKSLEQVGIRSDVNFLRGDSTYDVCTEGGVEKYPKMRRQTGCNVETVKKEKDW